MFISEPLRCWKQVLKIAVSTCLCGELIPAFCFWQSPSPSIWCENMDLKEFKKISKTLPVSIIHAEITFSLKHINKQKYWVHTNVVFRKLGFNKVVVVMLCSPCQKCWNLGNSFTITQHSVLMNCIVLWYSNSNTKLCNCVLMLSCFSVRPHTSELESKVPVNITTSTLTGTLTSSCCHLFFLVVSLLKN